MNGMQKTASLPVRGEAGVLFKVIQDFRSWAAKQVNDSDSKK